MQHTHSYQESLTYFTGKKDRATELELTYLPHLYNHLYNKWVIASDTTLLGMVLQRKEHIDAVAEKRGKLYYIEHKFDFFKPDLEKRNNGRRNVLIETVMNVRLHSPGWSVTTRADYLLFAFERPVSEECLDVYLVEWPLLKKWFQEHQHQYREWTNYNKPNPSTFRIIPIADIQKAMSVQHYRIHRAGTIEPIEDTKSLAVIV